MERITITEHVDQMCKGQDHTRSGQTTIDGQQVKYAVVFDGHGSDSVINFIRRISQQKMDEIMAMPCPATTMFHYINDATPKLCIRGESSGSTMCLTRIFPTYVEIINVGDSQGYVIKNGELAFVSEPHCYDNAKERTRLDAMGVRTEASSNFKIVDDRHLYKTRTRYIFHIPYEDNRLALSQALGHAGKTGIAPDRTVIPYEASDEVVVILGSDGHFDMVKRHMDRDEFLESDLLAVKDMSGEAILNQSVDRWLQEWEMHYDLERPEIFQVYKYSRGKMETDDVAIVKVTIRPEEKVFGVSI